jgi:hypothetical protein
MINEGRWPKKGNIPRQGTDEEFEALLLRLDLVHSRSYAAGRWAKFKDENFLDLPIITPKVEINQKRFEECIETFESDNKTTITKKMIEKLPSVHIRGVTNEELKSWTSFFSTEPA